MFLIRYIAIFIFFLMCSCRGEHTNYITEDTGETDLRVNVYGDTATDMWIFVKPTLAGGVMASVDGYLPRDSMNIIQDISVGIREFSDQDVHLEVSYADAEGPDIGFIYTDSYSNVADSIARICDTLSYNLVYYGVSRIYIVDEDDLPETLELWYDIKTTCGSISGKRVFKKVVTEYEVPFPLRWH